MDGRIIREKQDLTYLSWTKLRKSSGSAGSFLKAYSELGGKKLYYKISNYDALRGITGHECVNEIVADRLLEVLGIEHLSYQLIHADVLIDGSKMETWLCASEDFKKFGESKLSLDTYYQLERNEGETPLDFCIRNGWEKRIYEMILVDFLILNRDRHGANIEILRDPKEKSVRMAPLFDHGLSLAFSCRDDESLSKFDPMADIPVQSFVGSSSAYENLALIPKGCMIPKNALKEEDLDFVLSGLSEIQGTVWCEKIREMISGRWQYYADICDKR